MNKNIWIINEYAGSPYHGMEFRHYYLAKELVKQNSNVTIISSSYSHLFKNLPKTGKENIDGIDYLWLKTLNYGTSHDKRRVIKWFIFMFKIFFLPFILKKPDVIIVSPMAPFPIFPAWILSKFYNAKLIYEVKDIWPLSLIELGGFSPNHPFINLMSWFERFALTKSDVIVSNLQNYNEHLKNLGINRNFEWISNGVDLDELSKIEPLEEEIINKIPRDRFIVGYTGTIGVANALEYFCQVAKKLEQNNDIVFVIVGDGQEKQNLIKKYNNLKNLVFIDAIKKTQVQSMLKLFDVCYIGLKKENLFKYGVSPNKLYDYMYSAKPILYAIESGETNIIKTYNCGISIKAEDSKSIVNGVLEFFNMDKMKRDNLGQNGKKSVIEHFTYEKLAKKYKELF